MIFINCMLHSHSQDKFPSTCEDKVLFIEEQSQMTDHNQSDSYSQTMTVTKMHSPR